MRKVSYKELRDLALNAKYAIWESAKSAGREIGRAHV